MQLFYIRLKTLFSSAQDASETVRDLSYHTLYSYFQQKRAPSLENALTIAKAAGVSLDWLAGREDASRDYPPALAAALASEAAPPYTVRVMSSPPETVSEAVEIAVWRGATNRLDYMTFRAEYLRARLSIPTDELLLVPVDNDSAAPALERGGVCICHAKSAVQDGLWATDEGGNDGASFSRVYIRANTAALYPASMYSAATEPIAKVAADQFAKSAIGRVVWGGERFFN